ncbi:HNH endonuclease signature motif containing protein [Rhodococcus sp. WS3]|uniref:HNH endonuclease signature motif containing protein n=1 Tax=Rhodococcus sp. WS3 TaxID=2486271 RepID=UPI0021CA0991|nr:HNH endonuclease signature motif containing protein [Rhodococcus sp. WS3]
MTRDSVAATDRDTADRLGTEICALAGHIAAATARFLTLVARFDETRGWTGPGLHSCAHWLSWKCGLSQHTGREYVRVAKALTTLPNMRAAFEEGRLSYSKVRSLTRVATPLNDKQMVRLGTSAPSGQIDRLVAGLRKATSDDQGKPKLDRFETRWHWDPDTGDFVFRGRLAAQDGAKVLAALTNAERDRTRTTEAAGEPEEPQEPQAANMVRRPLRNIGPALVAMADIVAVATDAGKRSRPAEVVFLREEKVVRVSGGPALEDADADEVLCDARVRAATTKQGCMLSLGRRTRITSAKQMTALMYRDGCCRTPGCGRTRFLHAHHVRFWRAGGKTDLDNLIMLCGTCHRALHRDEFMITAIGEQQFEFRLRGGSVMEPAPPSVGFADRLLSGEIADDAIVPDWGGDALRLNHAVSVILDGWAA